jgi:hypothetical protein
LFETIPAKVRSVFASAIAQKQRDGACPCFEEKTDMLWGGNPIRALACPYLKAVIDGQGQNTIHLPELRRGA